MPLLIDCLIAYASKVGNIFSQTVTSVNLVTQVKSKVRIIVSVATISAKECIDC